MAYTVKLNNGQKGKGYLKWERGVFSSKEDAISIGVEESNKTSSDNFIVNLYEYPMEEAKESYLFHKDSGNNQWVETDKT